MSREMRCKMGCGAAGELSVVLLRRRPLFFILLLALAIPLNGLFTYPRGLGLGLQVLLLGLNLTLHRLNLLLLHLGDLTSSSTRLVGLNLRSQRMGFRCCIVLAGRRYPLLNDTAAALALLLLLDGFRECWLTLVSLRSLPILFSGRLQLRRLDSC